MYYTRTFSCRGAGNRTLPSCSQNMDTTDILRPENVIERSNYTTA
jgi:hypothetical protein